MTRKQFEKSLRKAAADAFWSEWNNFVDDLKKEFNFFISGGHIQLWSQGHGDVILSVRLKKILLEDIAETDDYEILERDLKDYEAVVSAAKKRIATLKKENQC